MENIKNLYDLQKIDSEIDTLRSILTDLQDTLSDRSELINIKIDIKTIKSDLTTAEVNLRLNQNKIDDIEQRIGGLEKRLYNGELRNNREIELTQNEQSTLTKQKEEFEDLSLQLMDDIEKKGSNHKNLEEKMTDLLKDRIKLETGLKREIQDLKNNIGILEDSRKKTLQVISKSLFCLLYTSDAADE